MNMLLSRKSDFLETDVHQVYIIEFWSCRFRRRLARKRTVCVRSTVKSLLSSENSRPKSWWVTYSDNDTFLEFYVVSLFLYKFSLSKLCHCFFVSPWSIHIESPFVVVCYDHCCCCCLLWLSSFILSNVDWEGSHAQWLSLVVYFVCLFITQDIEDQLFKAQRAQKKLEREAANQQKQDNKLQVGITLCCVCN